MTTVILTALILIAAANLVAIGFLCFIGWQFVKILIQDWNK